VKDTSYVTVPSWIRGPGYPAIHTISKGYSTAISVTDRQKNEFPRTSSICRPDHNSFPSNSPAAIVIYEVNTSKPVTEATGLLTPVCPAISGVSDLRKTANGPAQSVIQEEHIVHLIGRTAFLNFPGLSTITCMHDVWIAIEGHYPRIQAIIRKRNSMISVPLRHSATTQENGKQQCEPLHNLLSFPPQGTLHYAISARTPLPFLIIYLTFPFLQVFFRSDPVFS
jgi:hypothetical protein